jgi:hypothetical protein
VNLCRGDVSLASGKLMLGSVWVCVGILRAKIRSCMGGWMGGSVELCGARTPTEGNDSS